MEAKSVTKTNRIVSCPTCKKTFIYEKVQTRPFCSERCQDRDFLAWTNEQHVIPSPEPLSDSDIEIVIKSKSEEYE